MATTHYLIGKVTVGSDNASSVTFSNIPQTYTDLMLRLSVRDNRSFPVDGAVVSLNGSSSNITNKELQAYGSVVSYSGTYFGASISGDTSVANTFGNSEIYICNYTSNNYKSMTSYGSAEDTSSSGLLDAMSGLWSNTAAITSISLTPANTTLFKQYSTFYLYGISSSGDATKVPYASGGDVIATDGTYWYHAFKTSGTFTPLKSLSADVLVVAGGGGGGSGDNANIGAGGGGAGGVLYQTSRSISSAATVTVGAGGNGGTWTSGNGSNGSTGSNSVFDTLTANGGGYGGTVPVAGGNGGSGGGAGGGLNASGGTASAGSGGGTGYANAGGNNTGYTGAGGGGGGSGAAGSVAASNTGGAGGAGLNTWSSWLSATGLGVSGYIAGGGGGAGYGATGDGAAGSGGATAGSHGSVSASNATANTGSGAGGASGTTTRSGGTGGSGIVIVRYPV